MAYTDSIENFNGARMVADKDGVIRSWNNEATAMLGYSEKEAIGQPVEFIMADDLRCEHRALFAKAMQSPQYGVIKGLRVDGGPHHGRIPCAQP